MTHEKWVTKTLSLLFEHGLIIKDKEGNIVPIHDSEPTVFIIGYPQAVKTTLFAFETYSALNKEIREKPQ